MDIYQKPAVLIPRSEAYLGPYQTFMIEDFYKNKGLFTAHHFCKKTPSHMFDRVLNTPLHFIKRLFYEIIPLHQFKQTARLYKKLQKPSQFLSSSIF